jgi:hypothetical protein
MGGKHAARIFSPLPREIAPTPSVRWMHVIPKSGLPMCAAGSSSRLSLPCLNRIWLLIPFHLCDYQR